MSCTRSLLHVTADDGSGGDDVAARRHRPRRRGRRADGAGTTGGGRGHDRRRTARPALRHDQRSRNHQQSRRRAAAPPRPALQARGTRCGTTSGAGTTSSSGTTGTRQREVAEDDDLAVRRPTTESLCSRSRSSRSRAPPRASPFAVAAADDPFLPLPSSRTTDVPAARTCSTGRPRSQQRRDRHRPASAERRPAARRLIGSATSAATMSTRWSLVRRARRHAARSDPGGGRRRASRSSAIRAALSWR